LSPVIQSTKNLNLAMAAFGKTQPDDNQPTKKCHQKVAFPA
jgi:hypothetical protein